MARFRLSLGAREVVEVSDAADAATDTTEEASEPARERCWLSLSEWWSDEDVDEDWREGDEDDICLGRPLPAQGDEDVACLVRPLPAAPGDKDIVCLGRLLPAPGDKGVDCLGRPLPTTGDAVCLDATFLDFFAGMLIDTRPLQ